MNKQRRFTVTFTVIADTEAELCFEVLAKPPHKKNWKKIACWPLSARNVEIFDISEALLFDNPELQRQLAAAPPAQEADHAD